MKFVNPLDPYTLAEVEEAWRNRSAGVKGHAVPHEAFTHANTEIVNVIQKAGLIPSAEDLGQLWDALLKTFQRRTVAEILSAGTIKLTNLEPDAYYEIYFTAEQAMNFTVFASTDNGLTARSDYVNSRTGGTPTTNIFAQDFAFGGDMDNICVYTGKGDTVPAQFFWQTGTLWVGDYAKRLVNTPRAINAIVVNADAPLAAVAIRVL